MFIDETTIELIAGDGGNGCFSYERLKYKPKGKPDGGDGGRGGNIYFAGSVHAHTLQDVAYKRRYKAKRGVHGKGKNQTGKSGEDIVIKVPLGTMVYDIDTNAILLDCLKEGKRELIARGGRGGRGNSALVSIRNPNPDHCEPGKPGEMKTVRLVLKMLADVGLVGRPNAGKSTLLSCISKARPKIANYPFTTTRPHLGIVKPEGGYDSFVIADIPGIIEDCHEGKGLGIRFLKHIERTKILAILVESTTKHPEEEAQILLNELECYSEALLEKPRIFILTKIDLQHTDHCKIPSGWLSISAINKKGLNELLREMYVTIKKNTSDLEVQQSNSQPDKLSIHSSSLTDNRTRYKNN